MIPGNTPDACKALTEASLVDGASVGLQPAFKVSKKRAATSLPAVCSPIPPFILTINLPMLCNRRSLVSAVRPAVYSLLRALHSPGAAEGQLCRLREAGPSESWSAAPNMLRDEVAAEEAPLDSIASLGLPLSGSKAFTQQA